MTSIRMDLRTEEEWLAIQQSADCWQSHMPQRIKTMLLQLEEIVYGRDIDQLQHALQTATRALRDGASEELIIAALCHDIGNVLSSDNHAALSAEILKPYVSREVYELVHTHEIFQRRHYHPLFGKDPKARRRYINKPWFETASRFSDEWDQASFDPSYDTLPLEFFEPMIDRVFTQLKGEGGVHRNSILVAYGTKIKQWLKGRRYYIALPCLHEILKFGEPLANTWLLFS